jgi:hypothetical protein
VNKEKVEISKTIMNNIIKKYNWSWPQYCSTTLPNVSCENNKCVFINEEEIGFVNF